MTKASGGAQRKEPTRPGGPPGLLSSRRARRRASQYAGLVLLLVVGAVLLPHGHGGADLWTQTTLNVAGTVLALVVAALALVRYHARGGSSYLLLGVGFLGVMVLDGYHALVSSPPLSPLLGTSIEALSDRSWLAARTFLGLFLLGTWWVSRGQGRRFPTRRKDALSEKWVYRGGGLLTVIFLLLAVLLPLAPPRHPEALLTRPLELIPGILFLAAAVGCFVGGGWRKEFFQHALLVALVLNSGLHLLFAGTSLAAFSLGMDVATLLKVASYLAVGSGLLAAVYQGFRAEEEASRAVVAANTALARDMAERRRLEERRRGREATVRDLLDHAPALMVSVAPDGRFLYANEAFRRTVGYPADEIRERAFHEVVHPDHREESRRWLERVLRGEAPSDVEVVLQTVEGRPVQCVGNANVRKEEGRTVAARLVLRDRSGEVETREELARYQANLRALFESTGDAIWSVDAEHRLVTFNTAYSLILEVITGRVPRVGDSLEELVEPEAVEWFRGCYERALAGNRFSAIREEKVAGELRVFELFFNPIESDSGPEGVVVFSRDVTRRRRVEEALRNAKREAEEANRSKSQFLASMSHELRTPLNSVIGFSNILTRSVGDSLPERERGFLERILANGKHLLSLINQILDLSKIEAGRMELELESVDLRQLVGETLAQMEGQVAGRAVELRWEVEGDPSPFRTDRGKLKQVLINLVGNALKFTEEGEVLVRVETDAGGRVPERILVRDTGIGIPEDRLETIFDAFQQVEVGSARRFGGTGLGLTISKSLCELLGYGLSVASRLGEGTTFTLHLETGREAVEPDDLSEDLIPLVSHARSQWVLEGVRRRGLNLEGRKILVVDDEEDSRELLTHYLEEMGCIVITAEDGVEGLEVARAERPDLITVDLMMPRMSGWEMLRGMREDGLLRDIPAVVVSIVAEEGGGHVLGSVDLMTKPVERDELQAVLNRNLSSGPRKVLVAAGDPEERTLLRRYLRDAGLQVEAVDNGPSALNLLRRVSVDLLILDSALPGMEGADLLESIREHPDLVDLPVVVLAPRDLPEEEGEFFRAHRVRVIQRGGELEKHLHRALDHRLGLSRRDEGG